MKMNAHPPEHHVRRPRLLDKWARHAVTKTLLGFESGQVEVHDSRGRKQFGPGGDLAARIDVHDERFYRRLALGGSLGAAESYLAGDWDCDNLVELMRLFVRNQAVHGVIERGWSRVAQTWHAVQHARRANTRRGSRRNIREHYDLGNDFFELWLDDTLAYSSGIFPSPKASLGEASIEKFDRACRKLDLRAGDHLLEIGTGWGGLALHAARHYGCRVTTTTISKQQFELARRRVTAAGLNDRIEVLNTDYRDLNGTYDKLVSIEMIEAVGSRYFDVFFGQCGRLLKPTGSMLLQAILMPEHRYAAYLRSVDFIRRYVFPGGSLPSLAALLESAGRTTQLRCVHVEDFAPHYAATLRHWRRNFHERLSEIQRRGYREKLLRLWNFYLCYCEAGFEERQVGVVHVQWDGPHCRRDPLAIGQQASAMHSTAGDRFEQTPQNDST